MLDTLDQSLPGKRPDPRKRSVIKFLHGNAIATDDVFLSFGRVHVTTLRRQAMHVRPLMCRPVDERLNCVLLSSLMFIVVSRRASSKFHSTLTFNENACPISRQERDFLLFYINKQVTKPIHVMSILSFGECTDCCSRHKNIN